MMFLLVLAITHASSLRGLKSAPPAAASAVGPDGYCVARPFVVSSNATQKPSWNCTGFAGNGCEQGGKQFVHDFVQSCNGAGDCRKACAVVTAIAWKESGYASAAESWDFGGCGGSNAKGAVGVLQFDLSSGLVPFPKTTGAQLLALKGFSGGYTNFRMWASCSNINPAGTGWAPDMSTTLIATKAWCSAATGLTQDQFLDPRSYGCGVSKI